jgi:DNA-binding transcriptional regulator PaaX
LAHRLPIPAGEMMLSRMVQQGWIEIQRKDHNNLVRLTEAGLKAMRSPIGKPSARL